MTLIASAVVPAAVLSAGAVQQATTGKAYVTNYYSNTVSVIDTATNMVATTIDVGSCPGGVAVSPDGGRVYIVNFCGSSVSVIDTASNTVVATISVGATPMSVAVTPDGNTAYVTNGSSNTVSVIDTTTNTVTSTIPVGTGPTWVAITPDGSIAYVANGGVFGTVGTTVSVIQTSTNVVIGTISVGYSPRGIAVSSDGATAYVANLGGTVSVIDTASNTVTATFPVGGIGVAVTPDGKTAYVTSYYGGTISVINTEPGTVNYGTVVATLSTGGHPAGVAIAPDGATAYVTAESGGVWVIDTATNTVAATIGVGGSFGVAFASASDSSPPVVSCGSSDGLWHGADQSVACTASDDGSGLVDPGDASFSLSTAVAAGTADASAATGTREVCDNAGNCASAGPVGGFKIDKKPPVLAPSVSPDPVALGGSASASAGATDTGSGVGSSSCDAVDTSTDGVHTVNCAATDNAGNSNTASVEYTVYQQLANKKTSCDGVFAGSGKDVTVSADATCTLLPGAEIGHDLKVEHGGTLVLNGTSVGHDLKADKAAAVTICSSTVQHKLEVKKTSGAVVIGGPDCGANAIGGDLKVEDNDGPVTVAGNAISHDLSVSKNAPGGAAVTGNQVGHDATCNKNTPFTGFGNSATHKNTCG